MAALIVLIWGKRETKYFCKVGWTDFPLICPSGVFVRRLLSLPLVGKRELVVHPSLFMGRVAGQ
jgi:hypothetical protein